MSLLERLFHVLKGPHSNGIFLENDLLDGTVLGLFSGLGVVTGFFSGLETCTYRAFTAWLMGGLGGGG